MSNTFLGSKNLGVKNGISMSWGLFPDDTDANTAILPSFPGFIGQPLGGKWLRYVLNPVENQGSFTIGTAVALQFQIQQKIAIYDGTGGVLILPGRLVVYIPSTGQIFNFATDSVSDLDFAFLSNPPYKSQSGVVPVVIPTGGTIEVWFEQDFEYIAGAGAYVDATAQVNLTLFNVPISPVGV